MGLQDFHEEQARSNACVPACVCMVLRRRGEPASQAQYLAGLDPWGMHLEDAQPWLAVAQGSYSWTTPHIPGDAGRARLRAALSTGCWAIACIALVPYLDLVVRQLPSGSLVWPRPANALAGDRALKHAVLLCEDQPAGYLILDPLVKRSVQPVRIPHETFDDLAEGPMLVCGVAPTRLPSP